MISNEDVFKFLTQPENISLSMEIADYFAQLKDDMHTRFWTDFNRQMELKLTKSEYSPRWVFFHYPTRKIKDDWSRSTIALDKNFFPYRYSIQLAFGQASRPVYRLFQGVIWTEIPSHFDHPAFIRLKEKLIQRNIRQIEKGSHWIYWDYTTHKVKDPEFLHRMYKEPDFFVSIIVDELWDLFLDISPEMEIAMQEANKNA